LCSFAAVAAAVCGLEVRGVVGAAVGAGFDVVEDGWVVGVGEGFAADVAVRVRCYELFAELAVLAVP